MGTNVSTVAETKATVDFTINGEPYTVSADVPPGTSLNAFIRDHAKLRGTKAMCLEGGCGVCIVSAQFNGQTVAVNSCLVPVLICNGWSIKTVEGIGNRKIGYHSIQASLADMNGSQCGYCSPGMVMNMYSLVQDKKLTMKEIENSFGSNICRCTGYRPILDAFKSYASDAPAQAVQNIHDIEELYSIKTCPKNGLPCNGTCEGENVEDASPVHIKFNGADFHKVLSIDDTFSIFERYPNASYILYGGNTAHGVYRARPSELYVDINDVPDLNRVEKDDNSLTIGGNVSLTIVKDSFEKYAKDRGFEYLRHLAHHVDLVASVAVRNIGSLAGNLMIKHQHREFPSDIFLILETAGAQIHILESPGKKSSMTLLEFLDVDMRHKVIYSVVLPALSSEHEFRSYKIMPRAQNAHAHVNAGFLFKLDGAGKVLTKPNVIIGGINENFLHATNTENYLTGKSILDRDVFKTAVETLDAELQPDHVLPDYSPQFRKTLAEGLLYKCVLSIKPENVDPKLRTGGLILERELSSGRQDFDTDKSVWPVNKPIPKVESIYQTSGEAQYTNDIPPQPNEVFCAYVLSNVASGKIASIDAKEALEMEGVVAFFTAKDIPGKNLFVDPETKHLMLSFKEVLLADGEVHWICQPIGIIAACTQLIAHEAAAKVKVTYADTPNTKPVITVEDALATKDDSRVMNTVNTPAEKKGDDTKHVISGEFHAGYQYHFTMEPQTCVCIPSEDGMDVYPASHWVDLTQVSIANVLGVKNNSINIQVRRLGGSYGSKLSRASALACSCALVCHLLRRPARFVLTIEANMLAISKRPSTRQEYEVGVDDDGRIQYMNTKLWVNSGATFNDMESPIVAFHFSNCYDMSTWNVSYYEVRTDIPPNSYCRAPGSVQGVAAMENLMQHIATVVRKDPVQVRLANMGADDRKMLEPMVDELKRTADLEARRRAVESFNKENRWRKKGISLVTMKYPFGLFGHFHAMVSVYARDGTVSISHGGIECGQGIHTKVAQVAAYTLGIDLDMIVVKPSNNFVAPNNGVTGGSLASQSSSYATMMACKELLKRLEPIRQEMGKPTWKELIAKAFESDVELCTRYMLSAKDGRSPYGIYGVAIGEVEVDVLTGQHIVQRVDIIEDVGISLSPTIDVGQVEGAFTMGMGYWTTEDLIYDPTTGLLTNYRTWNYKPPGAKDIPVDFRVTLLKNAPNPVGVLRSKAVGEPPLCLSCVIPQAIREALNSARADSGNNDAWYRLDAPYTTEKILLNSLTGKSQMVF